MKYFDINYKAANGKIYTETFQGKSDLDALANLVHYRLMSDVLKPKSMGDVFSIKEVD